jgi:hypothetical protein
MKNKPSELFEGENSSLKKTFDEAVAPEGGECKFKEMSCEENCRLTHTHKHFFCEKCEPLLKENANVEELPPLKDKKITQEDIDHAVGLLEKISAVQEGATPKDWREEFDNLVQNDDLPRPVVKKLKGLIVSLLAEERELLLEKVEGLKIEYVYDNGRCSECDHDSYYEVDEPHRCEICNDLVDDFKRLIGGN